MTPITVIDVDALLAPISPERPCGPYLEYDSEFLALELSARGKPEQAIGVTLIKATTPDWASVGTQAEALFGRTKDLRVAVLLTRALIRQHGVGGLNAGVVLITQMLERFWPGVHPELEADNEDGTIRMNALAAMADPEGLLSDVRQAHVAVVARDGRLTVRDVLIASGKQQPAVGEIAKPRSEVEGLLRAAAADDPAALQHAREASGLIDALRQLLSSKTGAERADELRALQDLLSPVSELCGRALDRVANGGEETNQSEAEAIGAVSRDGELRSRDDVLRLLERACEFMERVEPAHPAPLLIRRAQRLLAKSFVEIIADLAPDSVAGVKALAGIKSS